MFAKLVTMVIALGVIGCGVLAQRQARLQAGSEAAQARLRIAAADDALRDLRARVATAVAPSEVQRVATAAGPLRPATNDIPRSLLAAELKGLAPTYDPIFAARNQPKQRTADAGKAAVQPASKPAAKSQTKPPSKPQRVAASPR
ncbi:MAG TPA: hypothetical protein VHN77_06180 [Phycisphaerales bacterium]|nr:hypothetical protein [Phycisphaerales bacterium]